MNGFNHGSKSGKGHKWAKSPKAGQELLPLNYWPTVLWLELHWIKILFG